MAGKRGTGLDSIYLDLKTGKAVVLSITYSQRGGGEVKNKGGEKWE
jgi:hypothetical protein